MSKYKPKNKSQLIVNSAIGILGTMLLMGCVCTLFFFIINEGWWDGFPKFFNNLANTPWWHHMNNWHDNWNGILFLIRPIIWLIELAWIVITWIIWGICWIILEIVCGIAWVVLYCTPALVAIATCFLESLYNKKKLGEDSSYFKVYTTISIVVSVIFVVAMYISIIVMPVTGFKFF